MPENLKRYYGQDHPHFITFSCHQRKPLFLPISARKIFLEELDKIRNEMQFALAGYVVMPEHVHLLISEPAIGSPSGIMQKLKRRVSQRTRAGTFWQPRFYDFNVYTADKKSEKLNYMHANPVERKLVKLPQEWPSSSYSAYHGLDPGPIRIDLIP